MKTHQSLTEWTYAGEIRESTVVKKTVTRVLGLTVICTALVLGTGCASQAYQRSDTPTSVPTATAYLIQYSSAALGFAAEHPSNWQVYDLVHGPCTDDPNRLCDAVNFQTTDESGNRYGLSVFRYWPAPGDTITDTVEYRLRALAPLSRQQVKTRCCLTVDGEPAMELIFPSLPEDRLRDRQLSVVHNGGEYALIVWWNVPFQPAGVFDIPEGSAAQAAFDTFLRSFTFIPIAQTPTPPLPVPTAVATPTWTPTPTSILAMGNPVGSRPRVQLV